MRNQRALLAIDGLVNLLLGVVLLLFPAPLVSLLGLPDSELAFYPSILGAVLVGIAVALFLQVGGQGGLASGLGLGGAVAINVCAGLVLASWLLFGGLSLPLRGAVILWIIVLVLVGLSSAELWQLVRGGGSAA
jgi:hypothetical protein